MTFREFREISEIPQIGEKLSQQQLFTGDNALNQIAQEDGTTDFLVDAASAVMAFLFG